MGKQENLYALEFINYYKKLGIDQIFIYDDNDQKQENFSDLINPLKLKNVKILPSINHNQTLTYTSCYNNYKYKFDWLLIVDFDEFLVIKNNNLKTYLSREKFKKCDFISFNWVIPNDNDLLKYDNRSLFERFPGPFKNNKFVKTIIRGNIDDLKYSIHSPLRSSKKNITCNNVGKKIIFKQLNYESIEPINTKKAYIIHFKYKSTEEYIKKNKKGYYNMTGTDLKNVLNFKINEYLNDNKMTKEKIKYIEKELNLNLSSFKKYN